jgi:hypothetical protein
MLTEFDQTTIANMTAALDFVCKKLPADKDSNDVREGAAGQAVVCPLLRGSSPTRGVAPKQHRGLPRFPHPSTIRARARFF